MMYLEPQDLDEAIRVASLHPAANWGEHLGFAVEVRPIDIFEQLESGAAGHHGDL